MKGLKTIGLSYLFILCLGDYQSLCLGKPDQPDHKTGERPQVVPTNAPIYITNAKGEIIGVVPTNEFGVTLYPTNQPAPTNEKGEPIYPTYNPPKTTNAPIYITNAQGEIIGVVPTDKDGVTLYPTDQPAPTNEKGEPIYPTYPKPTNAPVYITDSQGNIIGVVPTDKDGITLYPTDQPAPTNEKGEPIYPTYSPTDGDKPTLCPNCSEFFFKLFKISLDNAHLECFSFLFLVFDIL